MFLLVSTIVFAEPGNQDQNDCSLLHPMNCMNDLVKEALKSTAYLISYTTGIVSQPFLRLLEKLMTYPPSTGVFLPVWSAIVGVISIFYIFFLLYAGIVFITQGDSPVKRWEAKNSIKNMVIVILLVSSSFYLYNLLIGLNSSLTGYIFGSIDSSFFTSASSSISNALLQVVMIIPYVVVVFLTVIFFTTRWIFVSFGIILFPLGIFLYFVPFLKGYGKLIINILILMIFIPFISGIILLGSSVLVNSPIFENFRILFMTTCFMIIDFMIYILIKFIINKSGAGDVIAKVKETVMIIAKFAA